MKKKLFVLLIIIAALFLFREKYFLKPKLEIVNVSTKSYDFALKWGGGGELNNDQLSQLLSMGDVALEGYRYSINQTEHTSETVIFYKIKIEPKDENDPGYGEAIIAYNNDSRDVLQIYNASVQLTEPADEFSSGMKYQDINKDGLMEFVVSTYGMGNTFRSVNKDVYQVKEGSFVQLDAEIDAMPTYHFFKNQDFNDDGVYELVVADNSWEINSCTDHASGPIRYMVYTWVDGKYQDRSSDFPQYYEKQYEEWLMGTELIKTCEGNGDKSMCIGAAISEYFRYKQMGNEKEGWDRFLFLSDGVNNGIWSELACRQYIIEKHEKGEEITPPEYSEIESRI